MPVPKTPSPSKPTRPRPPPAATGVATTTTTGEEQPPIETQQQQQQQQQANDNTNIMNPPATPHTSRRTWRTHMGLEISVEEQAEQLARRLQHSTEVLLEKLFAYLSLLPEEEDDDDDDDDDDDTDHDARNNNYDRANSSSNSNSGGGGGGMTLPASAIGWLSSQYFPPEIGDDGHNTVSPTVWSSVALRDRLRLLRFLLPRVTHLRITRQVWPPELPKPQRGKRGQARRRQQQDQQELPHGEAASPSRYGRRPRPPEELNCSVMSVNSALTIDEPGVPNSNSASSALPTRTAFWEYMQELQHHPNMDMRVFPRLKVLVLESIPPTWICQLYSLRPTLQVMKWNRACLYSDLPRLFFWKPSSNEASASTTVNTESPSQAATLLSPPTRITTSIITRPRTPKSLQRRIYPRLTHLDLSHCGLGELSGLPKVLTRCAPHLEYVSLAHNDLVSQTSALTGLRHMTALTKLNLSHNQLTALPQAHFYLGGQLQRLQLSYNALTTVAGLDRLYALEELWLDHNSLSNVSELAGLCRLPQLQQLYLQGNVALEQQHDHDQTNVYYIKQMWGWFQQHRRAMTLHELPQLNGQAITVEQWNGLIQDLCSPVLATTSRYRRVQRRHGAHRHPARIRRLAPTTAATTAPNKTATTIPTRRRRRNHPRRLAPRLARHKCNGDTKAEPSSNRPVSFSLQDVLISLHQEQETAEEHVTDKADNNGATRTDEKEVNPTSTVDETSDSYDDPMPPNVSEAEEFLSFPLGEMPVQFSELKSADKEEADMEDTAELTNSIATKEGGSHTSTSDHDHASQQMDMAAETPKQFNGGKKVVATIKLLPGMFDVMTADWDDIVEQVAGGLIPDGKPRMPVPELTTPANNEREGAFSLEAADLLSPETTNLAPMMPHAPSITGRSPSNNNNDAGVDEDQSGILSSVGFQSNTLPDLIYPDDSSVLSSLGTNRDDFPSRTSKFQIAEENAAYDGPDAWLKMNVLENLKLYFEMYVFPSSLKSPSPTDEDEVEEEDFGDGWQTIALRYPRIQLWPEDRRWLDSAASSNMISPTGASSEIDDWTMTRERFVRVWAEDVIPCGKPALRRLAPNRRIRLGFHGDQLYREGLPDPYAEGRKVYLCLSSAAFYIILQTDDVTKKQDEKGIKKRFPNPIPDVSKFEDTPWPHAVARHTFQELQTITIGFEFQRLILQFSNPTVRKTDPYVYVLLTSNKKATVSILQEIQRLVKETKRETIELNSDAAPVAIENDSQLVLDALQATVAPEVVGTILHYQVVQQRWKHGEGRGTVRRICVVTDTKIFLMDEDYHADSHKPLDPPATGVAAVKKRNQVDLANVSYRKVDEATLKQVSEVQAAGADPKAITIVVSPSSRLSRTRRWRLVCRDSVGAERLVDDVRKAMDMAED